MKSILILIFTILLNVAIINAKYSQFTVSGQGCDSSVIINAETGKCQQVCQIYGILSSSSDSGNDFSVTLYSDDKCNTQLSQAQTFTCLANNQTLPPVSGFSITCLTTSTTSSTSTESSSDSSSSLLIASLSLVAFGIILSILF